MTITTNLKRLLPKRLKIYTKASAILIHDAVHFIENSNILQKFNTEDKLLGKINLYYHVVEKGLTMPETRFGFGQETVLLLASMCTLYIEKGYNVKNEIYQHAVSILLEYQEFHKFNDYKLDKNFENELSQKLQVLDINVMNSKQLEFTAANYFKDVESNFSDFSNSRYSVRNYAPEEIDSDTLIACIKLAQKTPSSCNRQPNRVKIINDKETIKQVLKLQYGNRGFGHLTSSLIILTSDISVWQGVNDRQQSHFNSGMFAMSLLYALHFEKIVACPLNWSASVKATKELRALLNIPKNELVTLMISCGRAPDNFKVAMSPRLDPNSITTFY